MFKKIGSILLIIAVIVGFILLNGFYSQFLGWFWTSLTDVVVYAWNKFYLFIIVAIATYILIYAPIKIVYNLKKHKAESK